MATGKKTGGKDFEPGQPGGPGRPPMPLDVKEARKLNQVELHRTLNEFLHCTREKLKERVNSPDATVFEICLGSIIKNAIDRGDQNRLNFLLDRLVGKSKESIEITSHESIKGTELDKLTAQLADLKAIAIDDPARL